MTPIGIYMDFPTKKISGYFIAGYRLCYLLSARQVLKHDGWRTGSLVRQLDLCRGRI